jgi:hypothetical protein
MYEDDKDFKEDLKESFYLFVWIVLPIFTLTVLAWFAAT